MELMLLVSRLAYDYNVDSQNLESIDFISELQSLESSPELKLWCIQRIELVTKDITLEEVSKEVNISPHYFSKLFKDEMGENFIDYLTTLHINAAKEIKSSLLSVKEICYQIGYGDPNYFSRIFKKVVGVTPTEYRDSILYSSKDGVSK